MSIQITFEELSRQYTASSWKHNEGFEPLPFNSIVVPRTNSLIMNGADEFPQKVTFKEAKAWGLEEGHSSLIFAKAQSADGSTKFCLRLVLNAQAATRDRASFSYQAYIKLLKDARFHAQHLVQAEGLFVPRHYGMWLVDTGEWAGKVLCSITQWCGRSWRDLSRTKLNTDANRYARCFLFLATFNLMQYRILVGRTLEFLHDYGVIHGQFLSALDLRHVILDVDGLSKADLLGGKARCYIVDFGRALPDHRCTRRLPVLPLDARPSPEDAGCAELAFLTDALEFMKPGPRCGFQILVGCH
ncbi:hypothetical protein C8R44DRAFT_121306 [Mycena epipterygia]|nr:hypothetical protein C8R44DRAFT_121306 [Mycena epipterygia]